MQLKGRLVVNPTVDGVNTSDYPDFSDAYYASAEFADTGEPLTDDELDDLSSLYDSELNKLAHQSLF